MADYTLTTLGSATELLDLPFDQPLADWDDPRIVQVPRGISRHVVRFIRAHNQIFAIKEATDRFVLREHRLLRELAERSVPVVDAFGTVVDRTAPDGERARRPAHHQAPAVLPAVPVAVHRPGPAAVCAPACWTRWPGCSCGCTWPASTGATARCRTRCSAVTPARSPPTSSTPRPASCTRALSDGQRYYDIEIATENIAGELFDLQAVGKLRRGRRPGRDRHGAGRRSTRTCGPSSPRRDRRAGRELPDRPPDQAAEPTRLRRLGAGDQRGRRRSKLRFDTQVVEPGHHQRRLFELTGLRVQENQARSLLADLARFRAKWAEGSARGLGGPGRPPLAGREVLRHPRRGCRRSCGASCPTRSCSTRSTSIGGCCPSARRRRGPLAVGPTYVRPVLPDAERRVDLSSGPPSQEFEPSSTADRSPCRSASELPAPICRARHGGKYVLDMTTTPARSQSAAPWTSAPARPDHRQTRRRALSNNVYLLRCTASGEGLLIDAADEAPRCGSS